MQPVMEGGVLSASFQHLWIGQNEERKHDRDERCLFVLLLFHQRVDIECTVCVQDLRFVLFFLEGSVKVFKTHFLL